MYPEMSVISRHADSVAIGEPPGNRGPPAWSLTGSGTHPFSSTRVKRRQRGRALTVDLGARLSEGLTRASAIYPAWRAIAPAAGSARTTHL